MLRAGEGHPQKENGDRRDAETYYRWRKEYGGMSRDQLKRLKELEAENRGFGVRCRI